MVIEAIKRSDEILSPLNFSYEEIEELNAMKKRIEDKLGVVHGDHVIVHGFEVTVSKVDVENCCVYVWGSSWDWCGKKIMFNEIEKVIKE